MIRLICINGKLQSLTRMIEVADEKFSDYRLQQDGQHGGWTLTVLFATEDALKWWRKVASSYNGTTVWTE